VLDLENETPKRMQFDTGFSEASLSPDGKAALFTRGRAKWFRKGYYGAMASQLWLADLSQSPAALKRLDQDRPHFQNVSWTDPMWTPDGKGYYYVSDPDGTRDVYYRNLDGTGVKRITQVGRTDGSDDGVTFPSLSADGRTMVFRRRFDLYRLELQDASIEKIELRISGDVVADAIERRTESSVTDIAFTDDGKQMAFVAGEDIWVMDRILQEPVRVTNTPHAESSLVFSDDGGRLFFVSDSGGEIDIWEATHEQEDGIWWLAEAFALRQITDDAAVERNLSANLAGEHLAYVKGTALFVMDADGSDHRQIVEMWSRPSFDWSPDGKWLVYSTQDDDYNSDVWVIPIDGTREPFNLSRHPDSDSGPVWSPDGKRIAFVSRRELEESDIYYINLTDEEEEKTDRDKKLEEALEAMKKKEKEKGKGKKKKEADQPAAVDSPKKDEAESDSASDEEDDASEKTVEIDFEGIRERTHRISIRDSYESGLIWSPDGKKLAFSATIDGNRGFYSVEFPDVGSPKKIASSGLGNARWLAETKEIVGTARSSSGPSFASRFFGFFGGGGTPAAMDGKGKVTTFPFTIRHIRDWQAVRQISFDQAWRAMRDRFYDERMNNRDWGAIRKKYRPVAGQCLGAAEFSELMNMMLGELNASHMGHRGGSDPLPESPEQNAWSPTTYHLGLRFELDFEGPGLRVESVIPGSPCHRERSRVKAGEALLAIDGVKLGPGSDLDAILTLDAIRDLELTVANSQGEERLVTVRPTSSVSRLLYDEWTERTRAAVEEQSAGKLGYLHIRGMNMSSFLQMEEDMYHAGAGKDGLIIDVRFNGGGSTADHVMTTLAQPVHAITKSRGSGEGYPQDRKIYASWDKPIVMMCNESSFSNAEIVSHAVKQTGRGRLVGMRTAGGVISTGSASLLDGSSVRMPTRGWYLITTGEDMELNGCEPDIALWNPPGGEDLQLQVAVKALLEDVAAEEAKEKVEIESAARKRQRESRK
jgi:tricorn protease